MKWKQARSLRHLRLIDRPFIRMNEYNIKVNVMLSKYYKDEEGVEMLKKELTYRN